MNIYLQMCKEFYELNGSAYRETAPAETALLRISLIAEELAETFSAMRENDLEGSADGIADTLYVIAGTAVAYGIAPALDMASTTRRLTSSYAAADIVRFTRRVLPRFVRLVHALDVVPSEVQPALVDLWNTIVEDCSRIWGLPLDELFREVHRSNMTKSFSAVPGKTGSKYSAVNPKGLAYTPPDIAGILATRKSA